MVIVIDTLYNLIRLGTIYPDTNCVAVVVTLQINERMIMVTNKSNNMLLFGSWSNRNNNMFPFGSWYQLHH